MRSHRAHHVAPAHSVAAAPHARTARAASSAGAAGPDHGLHTIDPSASTPSNGAAETSSPSAASSGAQASASAPTGAASSASGTSNDGTIDANEGLAALKELSDQYGEPIVAQNGNVFMRRKDPIVKDGRVLFSYQLVAKISQGKMMLNPDFVAEQKSQSDQQSQRQQRRPVKEGDRYYWQTMVPGKNGTLIAQLVPMSDEELRAYATQMQQAEAQQSASQWNQGKSDWITKAYGISGKMRLVSTAGNFVNGLAQGPNPYTGRTQGNWMTGYFLLQMLDGQADGKLLPQWMKSGPVGTALEWGLQIPFLLDMGRDLQVLSKAFPRTAVVMNAFTAPTRAVLKGVTSLGKSAWAATAPGAAALEAASGAGSVSLAGTARVGLAGEAIAAAHAAGSAARTAAPSAMTEALKGLGQQINAGQIAVVGAQGSALADKVAIMSNEGLQLVPRSALHQAMHLVEAPVHGGAKLQAAMTTGIHGTLGALRPFLGMLSTSASLFGTIGGAMNLHVAVKNNGVKSLLTTKQGRSVLSGFLSSASFLGMMLLPQIATGLGPAAAVVASGLNVASNVFQGVSMLSYGGLFGEGGYLDHDSVRAAFLVPPLTPIGLAALWMKRREKQAAAKRKAEEASQQQRAEQIQGFMTQSAQQLQASGSIQGAVTQQDGSLLVLSPFDSQGNMVASSAGSAASAGSAGRTSSSQPQRTDGAPTSAGPDPRTLRMLSQRM